MYVSPLLCQRKVHTRANLLPRLGWFGFFLGVSTAANAIFVNGDALVFAPGQTYNNPVTDTLTFANTKNLSDAFDNYGKIVMTGTIDANNNVLSYPYPLWMKVFNNYGTVDAANGYIGVRGNSAHKLVNKPTGIINASLDYFHIYARAQLENYGAINFVPRVGQGQTYDSYYFNIYFNARFDNYGSTRFDSVVDGQFGSTAATISNYGDFEITPNGSYSTKAAYSQISGETRVNGAFSASTIDLQGGRLSGTGTVRGLRSVGDKATIAPGTEIGALTVDNDLTLGGSLDIELGSPQTGSDRVVVNGILNLNNVRLNVLLRDSSLMPLGTTYTIITANQITGEMLDPGLPSLPSGARFILEYTGTAVRLTVGQ